MICPLCEAEIEEGSVFCNHCGKPIQVVPDYNPLEEDVLSEMINGTQKKVRPVEEVQKEESDHFQYKAILLGAIAIVLVAVVLITVTFYKHSYRYYYNEAKDYYNAQDYETAILFYEKAAKKNETSEVYIAIGKCYYKSEAYEDAEKSFLKAYELYPESTEVVTLLAKVYDKMGDGKKLNDLLASDLTDAQRQALEEFKSFAPKFSVPGGKYESDVSVELTSTEGYTIYYTLDGTAPSEHNGKLYTEPVEITIQGKTTLSAVCLSDDGKLSDVVYETYEISYVMPATPEVSPTGGVVTKQTYLTVTCQTEGVSIYYTWDDSVPTAESAMYTEPILVPEGNNILTVIAVDEHGMSSDVFKSNYIYYP